jgi:Ni/Fe-hydrogenase subunit HybB-like protein
MRLTMKSDHAQPMSGPLLTRGFLFLVALGVLSIGLILWRMVAGLGATTGMSDGYPWGIWIAFDVVTGTALACGGYAVAILVYVFNRGKYHPLIRPAILTSALGYSIAGFSVVIDLGRWWNVWKVPLFFTRWNFNSVLLEVALCIMAYCVVLWIELVPAFLEKARDSKYLRLSAFAKRTLPIFDKALIWIAAVGVLLPTMHQSSLGSLMLLTGPKLHPLWNTPFLPLFFLVTCVAMGYAAVVFETSFSSSAFKLRPDIALLKALQRFSAWATALFVLFRFLDLVRTGHLGLAFRFDLFAVFFWIETLLFLAPLAMSYGTVDAGSLFRSAMILMFAGGLYRFDTFLVAYMPESGWHYFPSVPEMFITFGLIAIELAIYVAVVKTFPILSGRQPAAAH